jgi:hypothetical protein
MNEKIQNPKILEKRIATEQANYDKLILKLAEIKSLIKEKQGKIQELRVQHANAINAEFTKKWIIEKEMTPAQIRQFFETISELGTKIDILDASEIITAVQFVHNERQKMGKTGLYDENKILEESENEKGSINATFSDSTEKSDIVSNVN